MGIVAFFCQVHYCMNLLYFLLFCFFSFYVCSNLTNASPRIVVSNVIFEMNNKDDHQYHHKSTPPQTHKKVRNPFDKALIDRLHKPICSPGMCKIYKKERDGSFQWNIDQTCTLVPADIVACNSQFEPSPDPALERFAEETTDRFFSQEMVMPSPLEPSKKVKPILKTSATSSLLSSVSKKPKKITKDVSAQTVLTLPPVLPPEIEQLLQPFCTFTEDQYSSDEYELSANGSICYKLYFEENIDVVQYDSEQTDDELHIEQPLSSFEAHTPIVFSPDAINKTELKALKRNFDTPLKNTNSTNTTPCYQNKILDVVDIGEPYFTSIECQTPIRFDQRSCKSSSLASVSISPVTKATSSDEEQNNFSTPESDTMATCLDCISKSQTESRGQCFCKITPNKIKRSASLKGSPNRSRKGSITFSEKRSLSLSSLHRSRSVQKLNFSMDMSIDGSAHDKSQDSEYSPERDEQVSWSMVEESSIEHIKSGSTRDHLKSVQSSTKIHNVDILDDTPIKGKCRSSVRLHEISKIRVPAPLSPLRMSLDSSLDSSDNPLSMEDKKIDFNNVDLKFLNVSQFDCNNASKIVNDCSSSFKRLDSGFNENTFYANASSYYESAIKPSELTVTNVSKINNNTALKEISNVHWMRVDSGFKDENSADNTQFYNMDGNYTKNALNSFNFTETNDKENEARDDLNRYSNPSFTDDMTFHCNFSSTPSKNKTRVNRSVNI